MRRVVLVFLFLFPLLLIAVNQEVQRVYCNNSLSGKLCKVIWFGDEAGFERAIGYGDAEVGDEGPNWMDGNERCNSGWRAYLSWDLPLRPISSGGGRDSIDVYELVKAEIKFWSAYTPDSYFCGDHVNGVPPQWDTYPDNLHFSWIQLTNTVNIEDWSSGDPDNENTIIPDIGSAILDLDEQVFYQNGFQWLHYVTWTTDVTDALQQAYNTGYSRFDTRLAYDAATDGDFLGDCIHFRVYDFGANTPVTACLLLTWQQPQSIDDEAVKPKSDLQLFPNPAHVGGSIRLSLPESRPATVDLFNIRGQKVACLRDGPCDAQTRLALPTQNLPSGVYMLRVVSGDVTRTTKLMVVE